MLVNRFRTKVGWLCLMVLPLMARHRAQIKTNSAAGSWSDRSFGACNDPSRRCLVSGHENRTLVDLDSNDVEDGVFLDLGRTRSIRKSSVASPMIRGIDGHGKRRIEA